MAELSYTSSQVQTINRARLLDVHFVRLTDAAGQLTGNVLVSGIVQYGNQTGGTFTEFGRTSFSEVRTLAQVAVTFGGSNLQAIEAGAISRMQALGLLPAGTIS